MIFYFSTLPVTSLSSHLHYLAKEICYLYYFCSCFYNVLFSYCCFKIFSLLLVLRTLIMMWLCVVFFLFLVLIFHWASWSYGSVIFINFRKCLVIVFLCPMLYLHSFREFNCMHIRPLEVVLQLTNTLLNF